MKAGTFDTFALWFSLSVFGTLYSLVWDFYIDWGFLRSREWGTYGLRDKPEKHKYPIWFYYWAMFANAVLRFFWVIGAFYFSFEED